MRLQVISNKLGVVSVFFGALLLTACENKPNPDEQADVVASSAYDSDATVDDPSEMTGNPCLNPWVIQGMKENIIANALESLNNQRGPDERYQALLDSSTIEFDFITNPEESAGNVVRCSAQANITYIGNDGTPDAIVSKAAMLIHNGSSLNSFMNMGITSYNVDEFRKMNGNAFSVNVDYEISSTYSENGEENESYNAQIGSAATMLASIVAFDQYIQDQEEERAQAPARLKAMKERIAIDAAQTTAENLRVQNEVSSKLESAQNEEATLETDNIAYDYDDEVVVDEPAY